MPSSNALKRHAAHPIPALSLGEKKSQRRTKPRGALARPDPSSSQGTNKKRMTVASQWPSHRAPSSHEQTGLGRQNTRGRQRVTPLPSVLSDQSTSSSSLPVQAA